MRTLGVVDVASPRTLPTGIEKQPEHTCRMPTRIALVSCVKLKRDSATPARDLYLSQLFRGLRRYAEANADCWYILSAEHGLVHPDQVIEPYERTLNAMPKQGRLAWADRVQQQLLRILPENAQVILLAGARYREGIEPFLLERGFPVTVPLRGLRIGEQLKRLRFSQENLRGHTCRARLD